MNGDGDGADVVGCATTVPFVEQLAASACLSPPDGANVRRRNSGPCTPRNWRSGCSMSRRDALNPRPRPRIVWLHRLHDRNPSGGTGGGSSSGTDAARRARMAAARGRAAAARVEAPATVAARTTAEAPEAAGTRHHEHQGVSVRGRDHPSRHLPVDATARCSRTARPCTSLRGRISARSVSPSIPRRRSASAASSACRQRQGRDAAGSRRRRSQPIKIQPFADWVTAGMPVSSCNIGTGGGAGGGGSNGSGGGTGASGGGTAAGGGTSTGGGSGTGGGTNAFTADHSDRLPREGEEHSRRPAADPTRS